MRRLLPLLVVPALALAGMAFAPTVGRAQIVGLDKTDKAKDRVVDNLLGKVDKVQDNVGDKVKGVPFKPVTTSNPEASSLAMMGVVLTAATVVGLVRRARKVAA